jgi:coiled-coil domain-containing protein 63/114
VRPSTAEVRKDQHTTKTMENQLDQHLKHFNHLQAENKTLRQQIDVMRKEMKNQLRVNQGYNKDIKVCNEKAKKLNTTTYQGQRVSEETNNKILALKAQHEAEKFNFERKIKDLQDKLKERDDSDLDKTRTKGVTVTQDTAVAAAGEFSNPVALLKLRLQKWTNNNKEKKNLMDMYIRNVNIIEDAFQQIKQQTGIASTEEIVTTFIKAEEQNLSLYNYVNLLNSEIDMIEEHNK